MRVIHTVASLRTEHGGPSRSVTFLCASLAEQNHDVFLVTTKTRSEGRSVKVAPGVRATSVPRPRGPNLWLRRRNEFGVAVERALGDTPHLIHDHGIWLGTNHSVARLCSRLNVKRVVSVRGMLSERARAQSKMRKALAWKTYQRRDLERASLLHATSEAEIEDIRRCGIRLPVAVIPNGIPQVQVERGLGEEPSVALFLSRLHPLKGLLDLVRAWAEVGPRGWRLIIAGPDEGGHEAEVRSAVRELGIEDRVDFVGAVEDEAKWQLYGRAELFILPSYSENFGITIGEALAAGVPVITTRSTPWRELETHECGWWIDTGVVPLVEALREATSMNAAQRVEMGERGVALIRDRYSWARVAGMMSEVYAWVMGTVERPDSVHL